MPEQTEREKFESNPGFRKAMAEVDAWLADPIANERMDSRKQRHAEYRAVVAHSSEPMAEIIGALLTDVEDGRHLMNAMTFQLVGTVARLRDIAGKSKCVWCAWEFETPVGALPETADIEEIADADEQERITQLRYDATTELVKAHVLTCEKHPQRDLERQLAECRKVFEPDRG